MPVVKSSIIIQLEFMAVCQIRMLGSKTGIVQASNGIPKDYIPDDIVTVDNEACKDIRCYYLYPL